MVSVVNPLSLLNISRESFLNRYDAHNTKKIIGTMFVAWDHFLGKMKLGEAELFAELRNQNGTRRYILLDQVVQYWKTGEPDNGIKPKQRGTIIPYLNYLKAWFNYNEIELRNELVRQHVKMPKGIKERVRGVDRTMIKDLLELCAPNYKGIFLFLPYTGTRDGSEAINLEWSWIDFEASPLKVTIPGKYTKTKQERITFAGGEAEEWLRKERKKRENEKPDEKVFRNKWGRPMTYAAMYQYFQERRMKLGLTDKGANGRFHFYPHKFRGYAENKIARATDSEFAKSILGHTKDLIQYNQGGRTDDDARQDYESAVPYLMISNEARLKDENQKLKEQNQSIQEIKRRQELLEAFFQSDPRLARQFAMFAKN